MGLIEDAKAILRAGPATYGEWECVLCHRNGGDHLAHEPDCPWLAMPRIVRAMEAAQQVVRDGCCRQACCNDQRHDDCPHNRLREAMRDAP